MNNFNTSNNALTDTTTIGYEHDFKLIREFLIYMQGFGDLYGNTKDGLRSLGFPDEQHGELTIDGESVSPESVFPLNRILYPLDAKPKFKTSFLVFKNQKYTTVNTQDIAFFYIRNEAVSIMCFDCKEYSLNKSLDSVTASVSTDEFFRVNRRYLINFKAIKEVEHYFMRKLFVRLVMETPEKLLINKEKTQQFLSWLENR